MVAYILLALGPSAKCLIVSLACGAVGWVCVYNSLDVVHILPLNALSVSM